MSRAPLIAAVVAALWLAPSLELAAQSAGLDPHLDPGVVTAGCAACHRGHGQSRSPMLGAAQKEVCLTCHGTAGQAEAQVAREILAPGARPTLMASVFAKPFTHRLDERVFSRREPGVTCTSCHSPHRSMPPRPGSDPSGVRKLSPKDPHRFEYELCVDCHGSRGPGLVDVGRLIEPHNRSYHPVQVAALDRSPSVRPSLSGREINCTDCHGNSDRSGPRGPHGSDVRHLLRHRYTTVDGSPSPGEAYALCFSCHRSKELFSPQSLFPLHQLHVVDQRTACATCHNPHGSVMNRGLIRYQATGVVAPSASGVLLFSSSSPGQGKCYLTCHGRNHDPEFYGFDFEDPALSGLGERDGSRERSTRQPADRRDARRRAEGEDREGPRPTPGGDQHRHQLDGGSAQEEADRGLEGEAVTTPWRGTVCYHQERLMDENGQATKKTGVFAHPKGERDMKKLKTWRPIGALALAAAALLAGPSAADPPVDPPIPGTVLPRVFCFRITDIRADKTDLELNKFHFEFEILNWSDVDAGGLEMSLAMPTPAGIALAANPFVGVDADGRPLFLEDTNGDMVINAADDEDANGNGMLDPGEDQNGNGRLDNDPIPGNLGFPNDWTLVSQTATKVVWSAPEFFPGALDGIPFINMIGAAGFGGVGDPDFANSCVPGVADSTATVDMDGNVTPTEAIDDENNVLDGFVVTVDGLDPGESLNINWFLTGAGFGEESLVPFGCRLTTRFGLAPGEPIGTGFEGNEYGFGVITLSRVDDGPLGGPVFEGNAGVGQGALQFFDSVYIVPDPAGMAAEFGAGLTAEFVNPADNTLGAPVTAVPVAGDADGDGVPDADDECPNSDLGATVVIGICDSGVDNILFDNGCTITDLVGLCAEEATNHGDFVSCVAQFTNELKNDGVISGREKGAIQRCAARADIP